MTDSTPASATRPPLSFGSKLSYSIGSVAYGMKAVALGMVLLYYNQILGLPVIWVSQVIGVALIADAIVHPLVGQVSDMWRSRWGRRHPFMYASAIPAALAVYALFHPPQAWSKEHLCMYLLGCVLTARFALAMFEIPNSSLLPEMVANYDERTTILSYRYFMGVFSPMVVAMIALNVYLKPFVDKQGHPMPGQLNQAGYGPYGLTLATLIFISIIVSALGTQREVAYMLRPEEHPSLGALVRTLRTTLVDRNFLALTSSGIIYAIGTGIVGGLGSYIHTYFWELSARQISFIMLSGVVAPLIAMPLGPVIAKRMGKKRAVLWTFFASVFVGVLPISLRLLGVLPPNHSPIILPILIVDGVFTATLGIIGFIIISSMMADIVEHVQVKTGKRSEGLLFSAEALLKQSVSGVGAMMTGYVIAMVGVPQHAVPGQVSPNVVLNLGLAYLPIMTLSSVISISVISFYNISKNDHESNLDMLANAEAVVGEPQTIERAEELAAAARVS